MAEEFKYTHRYDRFDMLAEMIGVSLLVGQLVIVISALQNLPNLIPNHFNRNGVADGYGSKFTICGPFLFSVILFIGLTVLSRYPQLYQSRMQKKDKAAEYKMTVKMILTLKPILMFVFFLISCFMIQTAQLKLTEYLKYLVAGILIMIFTHVVYWLRRYSKLN